MLKAKIFYIFLFLIVVETIGLLLLKRGLEMGYFGTEAIILAVFSFAFYNLSLETPTAPRTLDTF